MQKIYFLALLLFSGFSALAQPAIIKGKAVNSTSTETLTVATNPYPLSPKRALNNGIMGQNGKFAITVPLTQAVTANITYLDETLPLFLQPGDQIEIYFNADNFIQTLNLKGQRANENNCLISYQRKFVRNKAYALTPANLALSEKEFVQLINARKEEQLNFLNQYIAKAPVSDAFLNYIQSEIVYAGANDYLVFANIHYSKDSTTSHSALDSSFLNQIEINNPKSLTSPAYTSFLKNYLPFLAAYAKSPRYRSGLL